MGDAGLNVLHLEMRTDQATVSLPDPTTFRGPLTIVRLNDGDDPVEIFEGRRKVAALFRSFEQVTLEPRSPSWWQFWRSGPRWTIKNLRNE